jgi:catechol 2,3-dioxygenase-like lactoylglutathione lyase family enzyme
VTVRRSLFPVGDERRSSYFAEASGRGTIARRCANPKDANREVGNGTSIATIEFEGRSMNEKDKQAWYARPVFFVRDCDASSDFYARLGFRENWRSSYEGELVALQVSRAEVEIILSLNPERAGGGQVFFALDGDLALKVESEFSNAGMETRRAYWGMPVILVRDLDGNDLIFTDESVSAGEGAPTSA